MKTESLVSSLIHGLLDARLWYQSRGADGQIRDVVLSNQFGLDAELLRRWPHIEHALWL